jgi:hypothetical protein
MELWKANTEIHDQVMALIGKYHPDLALVAEEIVVIFREKASKSGGQVVLGSSKRAPAIANALAGEDYKFILEIGADQWENELTARQREALLDHLLTACRCEEDPKSGELKLTVARPDITAYRENVERYGMWFPREKSEDEGPVNEVDDAIKDMFGEQSADSK